MKHRWVRKLAVFLALACAGAPPAADLALLASDLVPEFHGTAHRHVASLVAERGHVDLVLSHDEPLDRAGDHRPADPGDPPSLFYDLEHVFHLGGGDLVKATSRRANPPPAALLTLSLALPAAPVTVSGFPLPPETRAHGVDQLRTVVLHP